jgi:probable HAF family extracellular repeat protein
MNRSLCYSSRNSAILMLLVILAALPVATAQTYQIIELPPPDATGNSYGMGINDAGVVVGQGLTLDGIYRAVRWIDGAPADLGALPGHSSSIAFDISNDNQVVGPSGSRCSSTDPTLWGDGQIGALPDVPRATVGVYRIKDTREAVGEGFDSCTPPWNNAAYQWHYSTQDDNWIVAALPPLAADSEAGAFDLNRAGVVVGFSGDSGAAHLRAVGWVWDDWVQVHVATLLPDLGGDHSIAFGINAFMNDDGNVAGHIVGYSRTPGGTYRAYFSDGETAIDLGTLPGCEHSAATRLNNAGTVIGNAFNGAGTFWPYGVPAASGRAFVWRDGVLLDTNNLIPAGSGWTSLNGLRDINERGQIAGYGVRAGRYRGFLLTPDCLLRGDLNDDREVSLADLAQLLSDFGCTDFVCPGDIDGDGDVDLSDLALLLANYGTTCP